MSDWKTVAPHLEVVGRKRGLSARPEQTVSDAHDHSLQETMAAAILESGLTTARKVALLKVLFSGGEQ